MVYKKITVLLIFIMLTGCDKNENADYRTTDNFKNKETQENYIEDTEEQQIITNEENMNNVIRIENIEGIWNRTQVASYEQATIEISNWKENESFDVVIHSGYSIYVGELQGTAYFLDDNNAVLYDENLKSFLDEEVDGGIYFTFFEDSIKITHDEEIRMWFGGGGIATAEGTYIQCEPEYTNYSDVNMLFGEDELSYIQELLNERYEPLFKDVIEFGEVEIQNIDDGCIWKAYWPPYETVWCDVLIYDDGRIYIQGCSYGEEVEEFYTNTSELEMPTLQY